VKGWINSLYSFIGSIDRESDRIGTPARFGPTSKLVAQNGFKKEEDKDGVLKHHSEQSVFHANFCASSVHNRTGQDHIEEGRTLVEEGRTLVTVLRCEYGLK
jgi:hypothetical protein